MGIKITVKGGTFTQSLGRMLVLDWNTGADFAVSVARQLTKQYTGPLFRARRSSDNAVLDIGPNSNHLLDETALLNFAGGGDAFVERVFDQLSSRYFVNATNTSQPKIVNAGSVIKRNGRPSLSFDGVDDALYQGIAGGSVLSQFSNVPAAALLSVQAARDGSGNGCVLFVPTPGSASNPRFSARASTSNSFGLNTSRNFGDTPVIVATTYAWDTVFQSSTEALFAEGLARLSVNGVQAQESSLPGVAGNSQSGNNAAAASIGGRQGTDYFAGDISEWIVFSINPGASKAAIAADQIDFYKIN